MSTGKILELMTSVGSELVRTLYMLLMIELMNGSEPAFLAPYSAGSTLKLIV